MSTPLHGIYPALITPMTADEQVDFKTLAALVEKLIASGVHGIVPLGSTGEFYALSPQERLDVVKTVIQAAAGRVPIVPGANASSTKDAIYFSVEAEKAGATGVLLAAPYYSLPQPPELFAHLEAINNAINIPIMLYNYPGRTGVDMQPDLVEQLNGLKNVKYIKESTGDITRVSEIIRRCGDKITVFSGCDTEVFPQYMLGAKGWVTGMANFLPKQAVELYQLTVEKKDYVAAKALFYKLLPILTLLENSGRYTQMVKAGCGMTGLTVGPPRRPLLPLPAEDAAELEKALACFK